MLTIKREEMREAWLAEVVYASGNTSSLGVLPSETAAKARCARHSIHAAGKGARLVKPLRWKMESAGSWVTKMGDCRYRVSNQ
jgi:hypothetical protein